MKNRRLSIALCVCLAVAGCTRSHGDHPETQAPKIEPMMSIALDEIDVAQNTNTKAPADGKKVLRLFFARNDQDQAGVYQGYKTEALQADRAAGATGPEYTKLTFLKTQYFLTNGKQTKMTGWYPEQTALSAEKVSWTIDGTKDVMTAVAQNGNKGTLAVPGVMPNFTFEHQLSQVQFWPYCASKEIQDVWGEITKIELTTQRNACTYTINTANDGAGVIVFDKNEQANKIFSKAFDKALPQITKAKAVMLGEPLMIEPQNDVAYMLNITVTTTLAGAVKTTLTQAFKKGTAYKVYLNFTAVGITFNTAITDWGTLIDKDVDLL